MPTIAYDEVKADSISASDPASVAKGSSFHAKSYTFTATAGDCVRVLMASVEFACDPRLLKPDGTEVARDDAEDAGTYSANRVWRSLPSTGTYTIETTGTNAGEYGDFTLELHGAASGTPTAVASFTATAGNERLSITWTRANDPRIKRYVIELSGSAHAATWQFYAAGTAARYDIGHLINGVAHRVRMWTESWTGVPTTATGYTTVTPTSGGTDTIPAPSVVLVAGPADGTYYLNNDYLIKYLPPPFRSEYYETGYRVGSDTGDGAGGSGSVGLGVKGTQVYDGATPILGSYGMGTNAKAGPSSAVEYVKASAPAIKVSTLFIDGQESALTNAGSIIPWDTSAFILTSPIGVRAHFYRGGTSLTLKGWLGPASPVLAAYNVDWWVEVYQDGSLLGTASVAAGVLTYNVTGLTTGVSYSFMFRARNSAGTITRDSETYTLTPWPASPLQPASLDVTGTSGSVGLDWPNSYEGALTRRYRVHLNGRVVAYLLDDAYTVDSVVAASGGSNVFGVRTEDPITAPPSESAWREVGSAPPLPTVGKTYERDSFVGLAPVLDSTGATVLDARGDVVTAREVA